MKNITDQELREHGFTEQQIKVLKAVADRNNVTYLFVLKSLRKRFLILCGVFLSTSCIWLFLFFKEGITSFIDFSPMMVIVFFCLYFMTPLPAGIKAYKLLRGNRSKL